MTKAIFAHDHRFAQQHSKFFDRGGLPESVLKRYVDAFGSIDVICRSDIIESTNLPSIDNPLIRFHPQPNLRSASALANFGRVNAAIGKLVTESDVVIARLPSLLGWMTSCAARRAGKPYLVEVVGNALEAGRLHGTRLGQIAGPIEHWLTAREVRRAPTVIYITAQYLQRIYPTAGRSFVCPNVSIEPIPQTGLAARNARHLENPAKRIGLIGSLDVNYKGHAAAITTLALLRDCYGLTDVTLEFAGRGDGTRWIALAKKLDVSDNVKFLGTISPGDDMMAWLDELALLLQPSMTEAQGRSIIEGMSRGCPVVASNVGGIPELLEAEWLTAPNDVSGLAKRCATLLQSPATYRRTSLRNWQTAHSFRHEEIEHIRRTAFSSLRS